MPNYPKFEQKVKEKLIQPSKDQNYGPNYGIILGYDPTTNRASILVAHHGSDAAGEVFNNIPCPMQLGTQSVAPKPGTPVGVMYKDGNVQSPMITHYFNHIYQNVNQTRQNRSVNVTPRYIYTS